MEQETVMKPPSSQNHQNKFDFLHKLDIPQDFQVDQTQQDILDSCPISKITQILAQHGYSLISELGRGGFSRVFLVNSLKYDQQFAVKVINVNAAPILKDSTFVREIKYLLHLNHPLIIKLYENFQDGDFMFIVLEYCENGSLREVINKCGQITCHDFWKMAKQISEAIHFCHTKNVAHRDIKPENLFVDQYDRIRLADFGFATSNFQGEKVQDHCGSRVYTPPEIINLTKQYDPFKADIWSLAITFFVMHTGKYPFPLSTHKEMVEAIKMSSLDFPLDCDPKVRHLIIQMTHVKPDKRISIEKVIQIIDETISQYPNGIDVSRRKSDDKKNLPRLIPLGQSFRTQQFHGRSVTSGITLLKTSTTGRMPLSSPAHLSHQISIGTNLTVGPRAFTFNEKAKVIHAGKRRESLTSKLISQQNKKNFEI